MKKEEVRKTKILVVEGKDEVEFFYAIFNFLNITDIQVFDVGGKYNFTETFQALINIPNFNKVTKIGIVRDRDDEVVDNILQSLKHTITSIGFQFPIELNEFTKSNPSLGVYIMPNNRDQGMLEDLCLRSKSNDPILTCVDSFLDCLENKPRNTSKFKAKCFIAANDPDIASVGIAAHKGIWDFSSEHFNELKEFISKFGNEGES